MLPKIQRITQKNDFDRFFGRAFKANGGLNMSAGFMFIKILPARQKSSRVAFIVSNKVDNRSAHRNKIKRRLRETLRLHIGKLKRPCDLLVIAEPAIKNKELAEIRKTVENLLIRSRLI